MATAPTQVTQYQTGIAPELAPYMQNLLGQQAARMYTYEKDAAGKPVMTGPEGQTLTYIEQGQYFDPSTGKVVSGEQAAKSGFGNFRAFADIAGGRQEGQYVDPATGQIVTAATPKISGFQQYEGYERAAGAGQDARSRVAGLTALQTGAFDAAKKLGYDPTTQAAATGIEGLAQRAGQLSYNPMQASYTAANAPSLQQFQMGPAERVRTQSFAMPGAAEAYMSPYMQNVVDIQQREARRASQIGAQQQAAEAVGRGAFGGSRDAIMRAERERNLGMQLGDIQATGQQAAYNQAQQQFNQEQAARLQAQQANQQAGLTTGQANLNALMGIQQLGSGQNLQAQLANQQAGLQAQQLAEQSRQYGAGLGLQGLQAGLSGYGQLAGVGQNLYGQNIGNITLQSQLGTQQQQQNQNIETAKYQDWLSKQNYPQQQMDVMASYIRGTPLSTTGASQYTAAPSTLSQVAGLGTTGIAGLGLYNAMNRPQ